MKSLILASEERDHLVIDNLRELLARINGKENLFAKCLFKGGIYEASDYTQIDIRIKQGDLDLLHRIADVLLCNLALSR